ncbi:MAG TPA: site-specific integrase [Candidatus Acidoferrales bacterium]|jgi:integrase|nr:site-specific integrase [Candidatus Acidoferrales bacterium]
MATALKFDVVNSATVTELSGERGSMARKRYQKGCVYLDGDKWKGRYREDEITNEGTKRVRREVILGCKKDMTKHLAERQMEIVLSRINGFDYRPGRVATFGEFIERWKTEVLTKQQPSSARAVKSHLKCYIVPQLSKLRLEQFGVENQQTFLTRVSQKGVSRKTVLNVLGTLSSILSTARDWGYVCEQIDANKLRLPARESRYEAPYFTIDQVKQILALAEEPWHTLFSVLALEGLRAGEALGLQWGDIDLDRQLLHVRRSAWYGKVQTTKSQSSETVLPIPNALAVILREYRDKWKPNPEGFLFVTRNGRPPSSNNVVEHHLWVILDALGFPRCGLHAFRHSHTALLLDSGATPKVVQRQLRHADARTTLEIYGHVVGDAHREAVEKVASKLKLDAIGRQPTTVN